MPSKKIKYKEKIYNSRKGIANNLAIPDRPFNKSINSHLPENEWGGGRNSLCEVFFLSVVAYFKRFRFFSIKSMIK